MRAVSCLERRVSTPAKGFRKGLSLRVVVSFDGETFEQIRARAVNSGRSVGAEIRELVEWGLEAESDPLNPDNSQFQMRETFKNKAFRGNI